MKSRQEAETVSIDVFHAAYETSPWHVASLVRRLPIEEALEAAFVGTQNIDNSWVHDGGSRGVNVTPTQEVADEKGCRSTSVGDYVRIVDRVGAKSFYRCCGVGWKLIQDRAELNRVGFSLVMQAMRG